MKKSPYFSVFAGKKERPLSVRGIVRVSKFTALFPDLRGLSLAAKAAADLRTLIPTIATVGRRFNNTSSESLMKD